MPKETAEEFAERMYELFEQEISDVNLHEVELQLRARDREAKEEMRERTDETAWLIEKGQLCLGFCEYKFTWVTFTNENALRFSRKRDAYSFVESMKWQTKAWGQNLEGVTISEHMWSDALPLDPPAEDQVCGTCEGEMVIKVKEAGAGHSDDLAEYEPCPDCHGTGRQMAQGKGETR